MKKLIILLLITTSGLSAQSVVNVYAGDNLKDIIEAAPSGTEFYLHPGHYSLGGMPGSYYYISKKINIRGMGYFLPADLGGTTFINNTIVLDPGSDSSYISGVQFHSIQIKSLGNIIEKCYSGVMHILKSSIVRKCYINSYVSFGSGSGYITFSNNIVTGRFTIGYLASGQIINNTFDSDITGENYPNGGSFVVKNNIFAGGFLNGLHKIEETSEFSYFDYNLWGGSNYSFGYLPSSHNIGTADPSTIFHGWPDNLDGHQPDARNILAIDSPARGAGEGGTDMGAFGGDDPYILSGVPNLPQIYFFKEISPVSQGGTLQLNVKVKSNH